MAWGEEEEGRWLLKELEMVYVAIQNEEAGKKNLRLIL